MKVTIESIEEISKKAGNILMKWFRGDLTINSKEGKELVSSADRESEDFIVEALKDKYPDIEVMAEENLSDIWNREELFIVDPLDGTHNFSFGIPFFCVSIAYQRNGEVVIGVIYDPVHDELFSSRKGEGSYLNGEKISVTEREELKETILATGFPYKREKTEESNIPEFSLFLLETRGVRRFGSAALDLAYVSSGRIDGFWEKGLKPWDVSAGGLIVREAGGTVTNYLGKEWDFMKDDILASNGIIHEKMRSIIRKSGGNKDE